MSMRGVWIKTDGACADDGGARGAPRTSTDSGGSVAHERARRSRSPEASRAVGTADEAHAEGVDEHGGVGAGADSDVDSLGETGDEDDDVVRRVARRRRRRLLLEERRHT